jgi:membrane protease YdiL (CAAX protease family)
VNLRRHLQSVNPKEPVRTLSITLRPSWRYDGEAFPTASRKGRDRHSPASRTRDPLASGGDTLTGNTKSKEPRSIGNAVKDTLKSADARGFAIICVTACVSLLVLQFVGSDSTYAQLYPPNPQAPDPYWILRVKAWWVLWILIGSVALPAIVMACRPGNRLRDCNLSFRGFAQHFWIYVLLFVLVSPVIWLVSLTPEFYNYYPMYAQAGRSWADLLMWEGMYAGQFVAVEFFFRGFLVGGLSRYIGVLAVPVSVMPYMMIHFSKPWPEAAAAIFAGLILGWLAWKLKSIWGGVCLHCAVAVSMDLLALSHKGQLPWLQR